MLPCGRGVASFEQRHHSFLRLSDWPLPFMNELLTFEHLIYDRSKAVFEYFGLPFDAEPPV